MSSYTEGAIIGKWRYSNFFTSFGWKDKSIFSKQVAQKDITVGGSCYIVKSQKVCPEYLYLYLQSETADKYIFYNSPFIQVTPSTINEILVSIPSDRMQELARLTFQAGHNTSQPIQIDRMNEFLREDKSINSEEHPFQSLMIEEFLGNIKMEKRT